MTAWCVLSSLAALEANRLGRCQASGDLIATLSHSSPASIQLPVLAHSILILMIEVLYSIIQMETVLRTMKVNSVRSARLATRVTLDLSALNARILG